MYITGQSAAMQLAAAVALVSLLIDFFAPYTAAVNHDAFQWAGQPSKIVPSPWGIWIPI